MPLGGSAIINAWRSRILLKALSCSSFMGANDRSKARKASSSAERSGKAVAGPMAVKELPDAGKGTPSGSLGSSVGASIGGGGGGRGKDREDDLADVGAAGIISSVSSVAKACKEPKRIWNAEKAANIRSTMN
jgi:hypothetical protein